MKMGKWTIIYSAFTRVQRKESVVEKNKFMIKFENIKALPLISVTLVTVFKTLKAFSKRG